MQNEMFITSNYKMHKDLDFDEVEFEIYGDASFIGQWSDGPYSINIWEVAYEPALGTKRRLTFTCRIAKEKINWDKFELKKDAYYHGGWIAEEFVFFASLILRRRLETSRFKRTNGKANMVVTRKTLLDKDLVEGSTNLKDLGNWLQILIRVPEKNHQRLILSLKLYWQAISCIEESPDIAYLHLISSIEVLSSKAIISNHEYEIGDETLGKLIEEISDGDLRKKILLQVKKKEKISQKFIEFIIENVEDEFWQYPHKSPDGIVKKESLREILKRIYNQRSRTLHDGEPFPFYIFEPTSKSAEILEYGVGIGYKEYPIESIIPYTRFFERLVNHVIKTFIKRNSNK